MNIINLIDNSIYNLIISLKSLTTTSAMLFISYLGSATTLILLPIAFLVILKNKRNARLIAINLILVFLLNRILKQIVARPRPNVLRLTIENGYSFPSGHAMVAMGYYGFLMYLIFVNIKDKKIKYSLIAFISILIFAIGISRIYLGVHYATDIIGGFIIAIVYLIIFVKSIYNKKIYNYFNKKNNIINNVES